MPALRLGRRCWPLVAALGTNACAEPPTEDMLEAEMPEPLSEPDARGTYLDVYLSEGARICRPTLERLDTEVERLADALGVPLDRELRIVLHYGDWAVKERCDIDSEVGSFLRGGCADGDGSWIAAQPGAESHELVHILRTREGLRGPPYWEEGLATYYGTSRPYGPFSVWPSGDLQPSRSLLSRETPDQAGYTEAAHFITFLDLTYGSERLRELSLLLGADIEPGSAFLRALDASLEDVEARWKAEADRTYDLGPICEESIVVGAEPVVIRGEIGCNIPGVLGPMANVLVDTFRGPLYCLETPPGTTLTITPRGSEEHGMVHANALASDACPADEPSLELVADVRPGTSRDIETRGCAWSIDYVSTLEGDEYEIELVVQ